MISRILKSLLPFGLGKGLIILSVSDDSSSLSDSIFGSIFLATGAMETEGVKCPPGGLFIGIKFLGTLP